MYAPRAPIPRMPWRRRVPSRALKLCAATSHPIGPRYSRPMYPLRPDPALASALRQQYRRRHSRPVVGLSWYSVNSQKDVPALEEWSDFIASFPATFVCLQYGDVASDVEHLRQAADGRLIFDSSLDQLVDIDAFAAQVAAMDAIVTIPNTTAHMGGAVGVPTIVVLDDRFHLSWPKLKAETPWYPSVTMIRRRGRNWQPVLDEVRDQLQSLVHEAMKRAPPSPTRP